MTQPSTGQRTHSSPQSIISVPRTPETGARSQRSTALPPSTPSLKEGTRESKRSPWVAYWVLALTSFFLVLEVSVITVALPSMQRDLSLTSTELSWITNAYLLTFGGFLLLGGRLADLYGRRRVFCGGIALLGVSSVACAVAPTAELLIVGRAFQGAGAAAAAPAAFSLMLMLFEPGPLRTKAVGWWGSMSGAGAIAGFAVGGVLAGTFGWHSVFWVNVPCVIAILACAPLLPVGTSHHTEKRSFDLSGAVTGTAGVGLFVYALVDAAQGEWQMLRTLLLFGVSFLVLAVFIVREQYASQPILPLKLFRIPAVRHGNILTFALMTATYPMHFFVALYLQSVLDMTPLAAGLAQLPIAVVTSVGASLASSAVNRFGYRTPVVVGSALLVIGSVWLAQWSANGSWLVDVLGPVLIIAAGSMLSQVPLMAWVSSHATAQDAGVITGFFGVVQQVGRAVGLAALVSVAVSVASVVSRSSESVDAVVHGYSVALYTAAGVAVCVAVYSYFVLGQREEKKS